MAALAPEIARHSDAMRAAFTHGLEIFLDLVARQWNAGAPHAWHEKAVPLYAMMMEPCNWQGQRMIRSHRTIFLPAV